MLLSVRNLHVQFGTGKSAVSAVDGVSLDIAPGETYCLVGESGSGKSVTGLALMQLLPQSLPHRPGGEALFRSSRLAAEGVPTASGAVDLLRLPEQEMQRIRGGRISMIFQEPMTALTRC